MGVNAAVSAIFAMISIFAGNFLPKSWGPMLFVFKNLTLKFLEKVWLENAEVLAHREDEE